MYPTRIRSSNTSQPLKSQLIRQVPQLHCLTKVKGKEIENASIYLMLDSPGVSLVGELKPQWLMARINHQGTFNNHNRCWVDLSVTPKSFKEWVKD